MGVLAHARAGAARYRSLLSLPGARAPLAASIAGTVPIGMYGLAILLLARDASGSFATAGRVVGCFGIANALGAVAQGRLMDRVGQPRVLRPAAVAHLLALAGLVLAARAGAPAWALGACALAAGASLPQLPAAMRTLWGALVPDEERRETAYALVSITFEVSVVTAPALVAAIVALASPSAAVLVAALLGAGGALAFSATRASRSWAGSPRAVGWLGPLAAPGMRTVFAVLLAFGVAVGVVQVAVPAFATARGSAADAGVLLAALSAGSLAGGLVYGSRSWPGGLAWRLVALLLALGTWFALLAAAGSPVAVALLLALAGTAIGPATIVASTLLDRVTPPGAATEAFAAMVMAIVAGTAAGNALGGDLVDAASYATATLVAGAIVAFSAAIAVARRGTLGGRTAERGR
ncbi:MAG: hypothetical protein QOE28_526 [Solirubrobacteraceae bacterium]|nr:hypothetical protein [Solirubrobacteraceae bacterium]